MKTLSAAVLLLATVAIAKNADEVLAAGTPEQQGQAIALELGLRNAGYKDLGGQVEMVLKDAEGSEARRGFALKVLERTNASEGDKSLIVFDSPADVKGTAVLSHVAVEGEDDQWLFLPSSKRTKRISSSNRTGSFAGSEFSFEDLTGNDGRKYAWKFTAVETCASSKCFVVEATPRDPASAYSKRVLHIDAVEFRVVSIDFFDRKGTRLKTLSYDEYQKLNDRFWRAQRWTMTNHQSGKTTLIRFASMKLGNGYSSNDFATGKLGN